MDEKHVHVRLFDGLEIIEPDAQQALYAVASPPHVMWYELQECSCGEKRSVPLD